ncbi:MAG: hypothetical protein H0V81_06550 [Solirubrobacterales bacterium]|nr:hypothetical protein [Solirubrobacterales bacterium]
MTHTDHSTTKGLARGPALILGAILAGFGLVLFLTAGDTPTGGFPDGTVQGEKFLGFETNGWTAFFTTTAGALLLFGAAQHLLAKTMSLLVGLALGACSVIALVDGDDVLGLAAANGPTKLGWGIAAVVLLVNAVLPRVGKDKHGDHDHDEHHRDTHATRPVSSPPVRNEPGTETSDRSGTAAQDARPAGQTHAPRSDVPGGGSTAR